MEKHTRQFRPIIAILLLASANTGCGGSNPGGRQGVSGRVTIDGEPLQGGSIQFVPEKAGGIFSGAVIRAGEYAVPGENGLPPGEYLVRISSPEGAGPEGEAGGPPGPGGPPGKERIPPAYNVESTIVIEVTASGPNEFDFHVEKK